jgi:SAM-dependent methyltransferase
MLSREKDAYGWLMIDHLHGQPAHEIVERDDGFVSVTPLGSALYFQPVEQWRPLERELLRWCRGRVLDVGCGAGRASLALQELGLDVVGVDNSPLAIRVCEDRGVRDARVVPVSEISRKLGVFDTILMLGNNVGLLGGPQRAKRLLRRWHALTSPSARIVGATMNPYASVSPDHRHYHRFNRARGRLAGQLRIRVRHRRFATPWFDYWLASPEELGRAVRGTGWRVAELLPENGIAYGAVIAKEARA